MKTVGRLLRANMSVWRVAAFVISDFLGLAIICAGVQVYADLRGLWQGDANPVNKSYMVVNRKVTASTMLGDTPSAFTKADVDSLRRQPWVADVGEFTSTAYEVRASMAPGGRGMSTMLFFESVPRRFMDTTPADWHFEPGQQEVPVVVSRDYVALYNFGFASGAGLPKVSEQVLGSVPVALRLVGDNGRQLSLTGHIAGYTDRFNTVLVPEEFMEWSNAALGSEPAAPTRLVVKLSSPGDPAINAWLDAHGMEAAGDRTASTASYLLKVGAATTIGVGAVIAALALFILLLSMSLLMEKNRDVLHRLLLLGYGFEAVGRPYVRLVAVSSLLAAVLAVGAVELLRTAYLPAAEALGTPGAGLWPALAAGGGVMLLTILAGVVTVRRKVRAAWRL